MIFTDDDILRSGECIRHEENWKSKARQISLCLQLFSRTPIALLGVRGHIFRYVWGHFNKALQARWGPHFIRTQDDAAQGNRAKAFNLIAREKRRHWNGSHS